MATNKFATVLLQIFLLINSLFYCLITKFANSFGLKMPCFLCSGLDHVFGSTKFREAYRLQVCEDHGIEILKLGNCLQIEDLTREELKIDVAALVGCSVVGQETNLLKDQVYVEVVDQKHIREIEHEISIGKDITGKEHIIDIHTEDHQPFIRTEGDPLIANTDSYVYPSDNPGGLGDWVTTVEQLKSAVRTQTIALNALCAEIEEERNASAVAASETMAMINRLQEEKAAMQMEASQYQRMMEEQAIYDIEDLQLMNENLVDCMSQKAELENELKQYRKKVREYELKERLGMLADSPTGPCSDEDSDGSLSI